MTSGAQHFEGIRARGVRSCLARATQFGAGACEGETDARGDASLAFDCAMSQSREMIQPVCARGSRGACSRSAARLVNGDGRRVEERESRKQPPPNPRSIEEGVRGLAHQLRGFLVALWLSPGRRGLALLIIGTVFVIGATAAAQVGLNAWNRPFYQAIAER